MGHKIKFAVIIPQNSIRLGASNESSMLNVGNLVWNKITHIFLKPKFKIDAWNILHLSLCNMCGMYQNAPLLFKNSSNPSCLVRFKSLISPTFKEANTLFNPIFGAMESSMQIEVYLKIIYKRVYKWIVTNIFLLGRFWDDLNLSRKNPQKNSLKCHITKKFGWQTCACGYKCKVGNN